MKFKIYVFAFLGILFCGHILFPSEGFTLQSADTYEKKAQTAYDKQDYAQSHDYYSKALEIYTKTLGAKATETLRARRKIGESIIGQGKYEEAQAMLDTLRKEQEEILGKEHRETLKTKSLLATIHYYRGDPQAMLDALSQIIQVQKRTLGEGNKDTLSTLSAYGSGFFAIGKTQKAKEIWEEILALSKKHYGADDETTLFTQMTLGVATSALGNPQKSLDIYLEIEPKFKISIGPSHWQTVNLYQNIATAYRKVGNNRKAQEYDDKIKSIQEKVFNENHPKTLEARASSARKLYEDGKFQEAKIELEEILKRQIEVIGETHTNTFTTAFLLAQNYRKLGELDNALKLQEKYVKLSQGSLGERHPLTLDFLYEKAMLLREMGKLNEAYTALKQLSIVHEQVHGKEHRESAEINETLIIIGAELGKIGNAEQQYKDNLTLTEKKFGKEHPNTLISMNNYATFLNGLGKFQDAIKIQENIYKIQQKKMGSKHSETLSTAVNLASLYTNAGDKNRAKEILQETVPLLEQALGNDNLATINAKNSLALLSDNKTSLEELKKLYETSKNKYGINHPTTLIVLHNLAASYTQFYDYESAKKLLEEGISSALPALGKSNTSVRTLRDKLASVYSALNMHEEALEIYNDLLDIYSKIYASDSEKIQTIKQERDEALMKIKNSTGKNKIRNKKSKNVIQNDFSKYSDKSIEKMLENYFYLSKNKMRNQIEKSIAEVISVYMGFNKPNEGFSPSFFSMLAAGALFQKKPYSAAFLSKMSILLERGKRSELIGLERDLQQFVHGVAQTKYHIAMNILMRQQRHAEAFSILYFLKEAELDDVSRGKILQEYNEKDFLLDVEATLYKKHNELAEKLYTLGKEFIFLDSRIESLSPAEAAQHKMLSSQIENMRQSYMDFLLTIEENFTQDAQKKALDDELRAATELLNVPPPTTEQEKKAFLEKQKLAEKKLIEVMVKSQFLLHTATSDLFKISKSFRVKYLQEQLTNFKDGIFIHTALLSDYLVIFLTGKKSFIPYAIQIPASEINDLVMQFRSQISNPKSDPRPVAEKLYNIIIKPIREKLDSLGAKTLFFSLDGNLRYIPMGALFDGKKWLIEDYNIILFNEVMHNFNSTEKETDKRIAAMGVTLQSQGFSALPSVQYEIDSIVKEGKHGILSGEKYLNENFTDKAFVQSLKSGTPLIHIASHFRFDPIEQQNSFLLVGNGKKITMKEMFDAKGPYSFQHVDLLALSACDTASGLKKGDGREIESFGALAQKNGAKAVLATLWPVADASTAAFMHNFYIKYALDSQPKGKALAHAQRMFINKQVTPQSTKAKLPERGKLLTTKTPTVESSNWAHPYFWAPFILMGGER